MVMVLTKSAKEIYAGTRMELILKMKCNPKTEDITYEPLIKGDDKYKRRFWAFLNSDGYMDDWLERFAIPDTEEMLYSAIHDGVYQVSRTYPIWKVIFAETMIFDVDNTPIVLEDFQKDLLLNPSNKQVWCLSRRLGKSFDCHLDALAYAVCRPPTYSLIILQSWDTAKEALNEIDDWIDRNPLILKFTKGKKKWTVTDKTFKVGSRISCRTATKPQKMRSKNPDRVYEDEKAFYPKGTAELSTMRIGHSLKRQKRMARMVMSSPNGIDNDFEKLLKNKAYSTVEIPICEEIIWDKEKAKEGLKYPKDFKNIVSERVSVEDLIDQWDELGQTQFMQDYMLIRTDYGGGAVPEWLVEMFFDNNIETQFESPYPCIISFDLGSSENHRSTAGVGEVQHDATLKIIRLYTFPIGTPFWNGIIDGIYRDGVFNTVLNWCNSYNVVKIIGDSTSMSSQQEMMGFIEKAEREYNIAPSNIIGYQWSRQSEKFMGKAPLYQSLVQPTIEKGKVKSVYNKQLKHEMRSWEGIKTPSGNITYKPKKASDRDDLWTMVQQMIYAHFYENLNQPMPEIKSVPSVLSPRSNKVRQHRSVSSVRSHRENYRRKHR